MINCGSTYQEEPIDDLNDRDGLVSALPLVVLEDEQSEEEQPDTLRDTNSPLPGQQ